MDWGVWGQIPTAAAAEFDWSAIPPSEEGGYNDGGDKEEGAAHEHQGMSRRLAHWEPRLAPAMW